MRLTTITTILLCFGFYLSVSAQTFNPVADAYVRDGSYANRNYGTVTGLEVRQSSSSGNNRRAYFRFNIPSTLLSVTSAKLRLYLASGSSSSVAVHSTDNTWTESAITWNNKPVEGARLAFKSLSRNKIYHEWDVTPYIQGLLATSQFTGNFVVIDIASGSTMTISSREASSNKPQLVITGTTTPPTIPAAPSGLGAVAVSSSQINLSWTDNSNNETGFYVESKTGTGSYARIATLGADIRSYSHTGLTASTAYSYRVQAYNTAGSSAYSNESTATTQSVVIPSGPAFYIDAVNGNDLNTGTTESAPWKNLTKLNGRTISAGTRILLKAGSVWNGQQLKFLGSGTATSLIVVDMYGTGAKPRLNGNGLLGQGVVYLYNQEFIEINNLEITNMPANASFFVSSTTNGGDRRGVMVAIDKFGTADHIYLKKLNIHHVKGQLGSGETAVNGAIPKRTGGIFFTVLGATELSTSNSRFNDILIDSCEISYCENIGFAIDNEWNVYYPGGEFSTLSADRTEYQNWYNRRNTNLKISNNSIHHIGKNAMIIRMTDWTGLIEKNVCYETALGTTGNTMFTARCKGTVFQYNEGYYNRSTTQNVNPGNIDGSMYDADYGSVGVIFQYSYSHDNSEGLYWGCNTRGGANNTSGIPDPGDVGCTVRYNVSQNDMGDLIFFNYPSAGNEIYNNVFYIGANRSPNIIHESSKKHTYNFFNNIIYNLSTTADYSFKDTGQIRNISHNIFYGYHPTGTLTGEPADPFKLTSDPLFVAPGTGSIGFSTIDGYKLTSSSPAINSGKDITANGGKDLWGNLIYSGLPDRGAHELSSPPPMSKILLPIVDDNDLIYPNPTNGKINIQLPSGNEIYRMSVYDLSGRMVMPVKMISGNNRVTDISALPPALYIISVENQRGENIMTNRVILTK